MDLEGHGSSPGLPGLICSENDLTADGLIVARHAHSLHPKLPLFLAGTSMGGAIALNVSRYEPIELDCSISGLILLAPM